MSLAKLKYNAQYISTKAANELIILYMLFFYLRQSDRSPSLTDAPALIYSKHFKIIYYLLF